MLIHVLTEFSIIIVTYGRYVSRQAPLRRLQGDRGRQWTDENITWPCGCVVTVRVQSPCGYSRIQHDSSSRLLAFTMVRAASKVESLALDA
jgi:hypothetical protein